MAITAADVAAYGGFTATANDETLLDRVCAAVEAHAAKLYDLTTPARDEIVDQALTMAAYRLWKRRTSPSGFAGVDDLGVIRVTRFDPDVDGLLADRLRLGFGAEATT